MWELILLYKTGQRLIEPQTRSRRLATGQTDEKIENLLFTLMTNAEENRSTGNLCGLAWSPIQCIMNWDLEIRRIAVKFVSELYTSNRTNIPVPVCRDVKKPTTNISVNVPKSSLTMSYEVADLLQ